MFSLNEASKLTSWFTRTTVGSMPATAVGSGRRKMALMVEVVSLRSTWSAALSISKRTV